MCLVKPVGKVISLSNMTMVDVTQSSRRALQSGNEDIDTDTDLIRIGNRVLVGLEDVWPE